LPELNLIAMGNMKAKRILEVISPIAGAWMMIYFFVKPTAEEGGRFSSDTHFFALLIGGLLFVIGSSAFISRGGK
jgi:predicted MFS family arabinose efflux permease